MTVKLYAVPEKISPIHPNKRCEQIVFHGVNKTGTTAVARTLRQAYELAGRSKEVFGHYFVGGSTEEYVRSVSDWNGPGFFIGHYLYGGISKAVDFAFLTQFRHPLPRVLSCYNWLKNKHEQKSSKPYASLEAWVVATRGLKHSQIVQFGVGYPKGNTETYNDLSAEAVFERCIEAIEQDVDLFGIAERFEESIFLYAAACGLPAVPAWERDIRNPGRAHSSSICDSERSLIEEVYAYDFLLYAYAVEKFEAKISTIDFGEDLVKYKIDCEGEYNDRILI